MYTPETPLTYILTDVNTELRTATLKVREEGKRSGYVFSLVEISGQIATRIQMRRDGQFTSKGKEFMKLEDVEFTSTLQSKSYQENPLKLVKFIGSDRATPYKVQLVDDKGHKVNRYKNAAQKMVDSITYLRWQPSQFRRYVEITL